MARTQSALLSDSGRKQSHNEDSGIADDEMGFFVVADGVGGHAKGEVASQEAVEQLSSWVKRESPQLRELYQAFASGDSEARVQIRQLLESGIQSACYMIFAMAELDPEKRGMSTTMSALLVGPGHCFAAHVGDSRIYRIREGRVLQLTEDHTLINYKLKRGLITPEEAEHAKGKNVITRAVGHKDHVQIDTADLDATKGDRFLLCSDGLHGYFNEDAEVATLMEGGRLDTCVQAAITLANNRGGSDNITAIAVEVVE